MGNLSRNKGERAKTPDSSPLDVLRAHVGGCRHELGAPTYDKCWKPAEYVLWGKLFPSEALGPRCYEHARPYGAALFDDQWAVVDLLKLARELTLSPDGGAA